MNNYPLIVEVGDEISIKESKFVLEAKGFELLESQTYRCFFYAHFMLVMRKPLETFEGS
jgi:hypothetical protein